MSIVSFEVEPEELDSFFSFLPFFQVFLILFEDFTKNIHMEIFTQKSLIELHGMIIAAPNMINLKEVQKSITKFS